MAFLNPGRVFPRIVASRVRSQLAYPASFALDVVAQWLRRAMCFMVPGAFVAYFPALALLGRPDPLGMSEALQWSSPLVAVVAVAGAGLVWRTGVRHYQGTGS